MVLTVTISTTKRGGAAIFYMNLFLAQLVVLSWNPTLLLLSLYYVFRLWSKNLFKHWQEMPNCYFTTISKH